MPVTSDAMQSTTNGCDFYFIVLSRDAAALQYGSYFGGNLSEEHVDGGTSRFDANGVIYQSVCAGCGGNSDMPTTPGVVSNTNESTNCNNAVIKIQFNFSKTKARAAASPSAGCAPLNVQFTNNSINGITYTWDFDDGSPRSSSFAPPHTFTTAGVHQVMLISRNNLSCNIADTAYIPVTVTIAPPVAAAMSLQPDPTCDSMSLHTAFTGSGGNSFLWRFGDGATANGLNAQHTYTNPGNYFVTLVARILYVFLSTA
jgi:PKD repeat protein